MAIRYDGIFGAMTIDDAPISWPWPWPLTSGGFYACQSCGCMHQLGIACPQFGQTATLPPRLGWECPRCHGCLAPTVKECERCAPKAGAP
jgi:hypothetical protein